MRRRYTAAEERQRLISEVRSSGDGVAAVAKRLGVTPSAAYLWLKEAAASRTPAFAQVVPAKASMRRASLAVEVGCATIRVEAGFDVELLKAIVAALSGAR